MRIAWLGLLLLATAGTAEAQSWPSRPVRVVVPYAAGGPLDTALRVVTDHLAERLGGQFYIDNRPGAGGIVGTDLVAKAPPDGHTLVFQTSAIAILVGLHRKLPYDAERDLAPISLIGTAATTLVALPGFAASNIPELIALARQRPGQITYGSGGNGTTNHLAGELLENLAGIDLQHVPYRGAAAALNGLLARDVDMMFASTIETVPRIQSGQVKILAVTNPERSAAVPTAQTIAETVPGYDCTIWYSLFAPAGTPPEIIRRLSDAVVTLRDDPAAKARYDRLGATLIASRPEALAEKLRVEIPKWRRLIEDARIVAE